MSNFKLSELGEFKNGANYPKGSYGKGNKIVNVKDLFKGRFVDTQELDELKPDALKNKEKYFVTDGDILFARSSLVRSGAGMCAMINQPQENVLFCGFIIRYRVDKTKVYPLYLLYLLRSPKYRKLFTDNQQTNITNINQDTLGAIEVDLPTDKHGNPDVEKQKKIVQALDYLDCKIELNKSICVELEMLQKILYDYWFTQFDFPDEEGKPYHSSGGIMEWNEQLKREIPKGWDVSTIGNILTKAPNTTRIQTGEYLKAGRIPVIDQSTDYIAGYTNDENSVLASDAGYVVFGDHTRIVKYIRFPFARGADGTQVLKTNTPCVPDELLYQIVKNVDLSNYGYARHFKFLKDTLAVIPNETVAKKYKQIVTPIYDKQVQLTFENVELTKLRDWLLPMLMNGQATVE